MQTTAPGRASGPRSCPARPSRILPRCGWQIGAGHNSGRWAGYWAVLQDDQRSAVSRGENAGATLHNDHVVRLYQPVSPWPSNQPMQQTLDLTAGPGQRVVFVVTQADGLKPVQAAVLRCGS